jgi:tryptophan halogenase
MHLCIVGTGAAGWMACNLFKDNERVPNIKKITVIKSTENPPIGVGESNTLILNNIHHSMGIKLNEFVTKSDASCKTGVYYQNWSKNNFLHFFKGDQPWNDLRMHPNAYGKILANKPIDLNINSVFGNFITDCSLQNRVCLDQYHYPMSWHFDAGKYISFMTNIAIESKKVKIVEDTVIDCIFSQRETLEKLLLKSGKTIEADYYIFATGESNKISKMLNEEYNDLSDVLLTDSAFVYPLEYTNKNKQFHPYTVSKTMKCGWRWITPTYSRIGTGYVFSSAHISEEDALQEFLNDIGDTTLTPKLVKFIPRYSKKTFKNNYCTIGMANGFLEPLDAPGLSLSIITLAKLETLFIQKSIIDNDKVLDCMKESNNRHITDLYEFWASFILCQYKTCHRNDTQFWLDHKNVVYEPYEYIFNNLDKLDDSYAGYIMFYHTISAKDIRWKTKNSSIPFKVPDLVKETIPHLEYIKMLREHYYESRNKSSQNIWIR